MSEDSDPKCPDCQVPPGSMHRDRCDVARCLFTGRQRLMDGHAPKMGCNTVWRGAWPGEAECVEYGWYAYFVPGEGWVPCDKDALGAGPDLNRLYRECVWDMTIQRMVKR